MEHQTTRHMRRKWGFYLVTWGVLLYVKPQKGYYESEGVPGNKTPVEMLLILLTGCGVI